MSAKALGDRALMLSRVRAALAGPPLPEAGLFTTSLTYYFTLGVELKTQKCVLLGIMGYLDNDEATCKRARLPSCRSARATSPPRRSRLGCDIHTHAPAPKGSTNFIVYLVSLVPIRSQKLFYEFPRAWAWAWV